MTFTFSGWEKVKEDFHMRKSYEIVPTNKVLLEHNRVHSSTGFVLH